jgi:hypothetical protein
MSSADARRWKGRGWKAIEPNGESDLVTLWRQLGDTAEAPRRCSEVDWAKLIGVAPPVDFECRAYGNRVGVRFIRRKSRKDYEVNGELLGAVAPAADLEGLDFSSLKGVAA